MSLTETSIAFLWPRPPAAIGDLSKDALTRKVAAVWERDGVVLPEQQAENTIVLLALRQVASRA